mmetsp:Transcript_24626/g.78093  ORF Transcript_24626/g.78093 Transcript_24626/m.78093 type:complete len:218 (+) Transcript_24626:125-778(+)
MDYSRFDHIGSSSSSDDDDAPLPPRHPPPAVRDDLEDYFRRLDERRSRSEPADAAVVPRFTAAEISQLRSFPFEPSGAAADSSARSECAICLCEFESGQQLTALPCAAAHAFHSDCVRGALAASVHCPLCRVDVRSLVLSPAAPSDGPAPASPRSLGFTRDGGIIQRYDPHPPAALERPAYIPPHRAGHAELVEIAYPEHGVARVWRLPRELQEEDG